MRKTSSLIWFCGLATILLFGGITHMQAEETMDDKVAAAKAAQAIAEAQKGVAEARKAQADAELGAFKAQMEITGASYTGNVDMKDRAGAMEAALLAAKALNSAADGIASNIRDAEPTKTILLYSSTDAPNFQALAAFRAEVAALKTAFADAQFLSKVADSSLPPPDVKKEVVPPVVALGATLAAADKLLSFFRTDYTVGGIELTFDDSALLHSLAGAIKSTNRTVRLPALYQQLPNTLSDESGVVKDLRSLDSMKGSSQRIADRQDKLAETDVKSAKAHRDAAAALRAACTAYDTWFSKATLADDKGNVPMANVVREGIVADGLAGGDLLLVAKLQKVGGSYYTKKNFLTFFGGMPFFHMGGAVISYVLFEGKTGEVLRSGLVPVHGGFFKAHKLQREIDAK